MAWTRFTRLECENLFDGRLNLVATDPRQHWGRVADTEVSELVVCSAIR